MPSVRKKLARVELWDDIEADGGSRLHFFAGVVIAEDSYELNGVEELRLEVARDLVYWDDIEHDRVVRTVDEDGNFDEWRIRKINDGKGAAGKENVTLNCDSVRFDLVNNSAIMERAEFDGSCNTHFEYYGLTPAQHAAVILEWGPDYFELHPSFPDLDAVDMIYHDDTPLSALVELATIIGFELEVTRNGTSSYYVNLVEEIGSAIDQVEIRNGGNLITGSRQQDSTDMGTRVYVRGGQQFGREGTLAGASFLVVNPAVPEETFSIDFTLAEDIIGEDAQLNGLYIIGHDGGHSQVIASIAPRTIRVATPTKLPPDGRLRFQRSYVDLVTSDTLYCDLTYLDFPSAIATYGIKPALLERSDIPAVNNLIPNPFLTAWDDGGLPVSFQRLQESGSPTIRQETHPLYTRHGGSSASIRALPGQGIRTAVFRVIPTEANPFLVVQAQLFVASGNVRMEMRELTLDPELYETVFPPPGVIATTVTQGGWVDSFGVNPGGSPEDNWYTKMTEANKTFLKFEITLMGGTDPLAEVAEITHFYLDALQVTQTPSFSEVFFGGRASNELWKLGNIALDGLSTPAQDYRIQIIDLWRLDPDNYTVNEIVLGGPIRLVDEEISLDFTTRIIKVTRDLLVEGQTQIEVENITNDLSRIIGAAERRIRRELMTGEGYDPTTGLLTGPDDDGFADNPTEDDNIAGDEDIDQCYAAALEHCSDDSAGAYSFFTYTENKIDLAADGLAVGTELAWGFQGKVTRTGGGGDDPPPPGGETNPENTVKRLTSGLVWGMDNKGAGNINRWDWTKWTNVAGTWAVRDGAKLVCTSVGGGITICNDFTPIGDMVVHVRWEADPCWQDVDCNQHAPRGDGIFPICRMEASGGAVTYGYGMEWDFSCHAAFPCGSQRTDVVRSSVKYNGGSKSVLTGPTAGSDMAQTLVKSYHKYKAFDGEQKVWIAGGSYPGFDSADGSLSGRTGTVGFRFDETSDAAIIAVYVCSANEITCSNLPTGYYFGTSFGNAVQETAGVSISDLGGLHLPVTSLRVWSGPPASDTEVANFSPEGGIFGGDTYWFEPSTGDPEDPEDPDGPLDDDTILAASIDLEFYDSDDLMILSTYHDGVSSTDEYSRGTGSVVIPANASYILPVAKRVGGGEGIACVKELVVNIGTIAIAFAPCDLLFKDSARAARIPVDQGLLCHLPFDDFKYAKPDSDTQDYPGSGEWANAKPDPDGTIELSRIEYDSSHNRNHFALITYFWSYGILQRQPEPYTPGYGSFMAPCPGVSGLGRVLPDWLGLWRWPYTSSALYLKEPAVLDRGNTPAPMDVFEDFTVSFWFRPTLNSWMDSSLVSLIGFFNGIAAGWDSHPGPYEIERGGFQIWVTSGWDIDWGHLWVEYFTQHTSFTDWATGDLEKVFVTLTADPCWGDCDTGLVPEGLARDDGVSFARAYSFYSISFSAKVPGSSPSQPNAGGGNIQNVKAFHGNALTGQFKKLTDADLITGGGSQLESMNSVPAMEGFSNRGTNPNNSSRFTLFGQMVNQGQIDNTAYTKDPSAGMFDEFRLYERVLSDDEVYGLFMLGCGSQPHTQVCSQIYEGMDGAGATLPYLYDSQTECGGADSAAKIIMSQTLI